MVSPQTSTHNNHMFPHYHPPPATTRCPASERPIANVLQPRNVTKFWVKPFDPFFRHLTPWKINILNLKITCFKRKIIFHPSSIFGFKKPLIFQSENPAGFLLAPPFFGWIWDPTFFWGGPISNPIDSDFAVDTWIVDGRGDWKILNEHLAFQEKQMHHPMVSIAPTISNGEPSHIVVISTTPLCLVPSLWLLLLYS